MATAAIRKQQEDRARLRASADRGYAAEVFSDELVVAGSAFVKLLLARDWVDDDITDGLKNQLMRAAVSIPSNVAEGVGKGTMQQMLQFLRHARGSAYEVLVQVQFLTGRDVKQLTVEAEKLATAIDGRVVAWCDKCVAAEIGQPP